MTTGPVWFVSFAVALYQQTFRYSLAFSKALHTKRVIINFEVQRSEVSIACI